MTKNNKLFYGILIALIVVISIYIGIAIFFKSYRPPTPTPPNINQQQNANNKNIVVNTNIYSDPERTAREFLATQEDIKIDQLGNGSTYTGSSGKIYVNFPQVIDGMPVYDGIVTVIIYKDGKINLYKSTFKQINSVDKPKLSEKEAKDIIKNALEEESPGVKLKFYATELIIYPKPLEKPENYYTTWKIDVNTENPFGSWRYFIDAVNGGVIEKQWMIIEE